MDFETLEIENEGCVRRIWLNRGEAANAQTQRMLIELDKAFELANADDEVRVIVLAAHGKHFSAGHDLKEAGAKRGYFTAQQRFEYEHYHYLSYCLNIWYSKKPTISQVQGACIAGGMMLANMTDLIVAADDAWFWDSVMFSMALAGTEVLFQPWVMGLRHAKEFLLLGERIDARDAHRIGMVNRIFAASELAAKTMELAQHMAKAPPFGMQSLKKSLNQTYDIQGFRNAVQNHFNIHQITHASSEIAEIRDRGMDRVIQGNKQDAGKHGQ